MGRIVKYYPEEGEKVLKLLPLSFPDLKQKSGYGKNKLRTILRELHREQKIMYNITDGIIEHRSRNGT